MTLWLIQMYVKYTGYTVNVNCIQSVNLMTGIFHDNNPILVLDVVLDIHFIKLRVEKSSS